MGSRSSRHGTAVGCTCSHAPHQRHATPFLNGPEHSGRTYDAHLSPKIVHLVKRFLSSVSKLHLCIRVMSTAFSSLPVVDVGILRAADATPEDLTELSANLHDIFATTGFAYLVNAPLSFDHGEIFGLSREFFSLPSNQRMKLAKKSFRPSHHNTYRGWVSRRGNTVVCRG